jgi:hypothetical protein
MDNLQKEILKFLWSRQLEGLTKQKQRLLTKNRIASGLSRDGWPRHSVPRKYSAKLSAKSSTKIYQKQNQLHTDSFLPRILDKLILRVNRPSLRDLVERLGQNSGS